MYADRVAEHDAAEPGYATKWDALTTAILRHGGVLVVPPLTPEPRPGTIARDLTTWDPRTTPVRHVTGQDNHCHGNSAEMWLTGHAHALATGYALNDDGLWRQHSWALDADGTLIETTVSRDLYAGIVLSDVELWRFALSNADTNELELAEVRIRELPKIVHQLDNLATDSSR